MPENIRPVLLVFAIFFHLYMFMKELQASRNLIAFCFELSPDWSVLPGVPEGLKKLKQLCCC